MANTSDSQSRGFGSMAAVAGLLQHGANGMHGQSYGQAAPPAYGYGPNPTPAYPQGPAPPGYPSQQPQFTQQPPYGQQPAYGHQPQYAPQPAYPQQAHPQHQAMPMQHSPATGQLMLTSPQFVYPHAVDLVLRERYGIAQNDDFAIMDARTGAPMFRLDAKLLSFSDRRMLLDAYGRPVVQMQKKLMSMHGTWLMNTPAGVRIAEVKPALFAFPTPSFKVYFNDGDDVPDLVASGNFRARSFTISHRPRGGAERVVATVKKESRFAGMESFFRNSMLDSQTYFLHVEPGMDVAFMAALATLIDEMFHDQK